MENYKVLALEIKEHLNKWRLCVYANLYKYILFIKWKTYYYLDVIFKEI